MCLPFSTSTACDSGSGQYEAPAMRRMVTCSLCAPRHARSESMVTALRKHPTATTCRRMLWPCYNHPTATRNMDRDVQPARVTLDMVAGRRGRWPATNRLPGSSRSAPRDTPLSRGRERLCRIAAQLRCASRPLPIVDLTDARAPARRQSPHGGEIHLMARPRRAATASLWASM